ncbi:hypothetical protein F2Q69_00059536 [Brassica cretica]|uniref:Uncharacterized protein n=1 Tax=Brassica cretica TaxID=69181 RepID=A0A8S9RNY8_BRACR|nr:hypothetical protein F2Q69_00059536 [Brassica cretica]
MCSLERIGVITSLRTSGFPIRSPDLRENPVFSHDLRVQLRSQDLSKNLRVPIPPPGTSHDPRSKENLRAPPRPLGPETTPGEPLGPEYDLRIQGEPSGTSTTSRSLDDPQVLTQHPCYEISLQTPRVHTLARNLVGVKSGHDEVNIQISVKIGMNAFTKSNLRKEILAKNFAVKTCTSLG